MYNKNSFPNKKEDEEVLIFLRRHWIAVYKIIFITSILFLFQIIISYLIIKNSLIVTELNYALFILLNSAFLLFLIMFAYSNFIDYYLDVWIVTNKRVVNIEQKGLFAREVSEKELSKMQDITSNVKGIWATFLNYGDIIIQTAGEEQRFIFRQVPQAEKFSREISNIAAQNNGQDKTEKL